MEVKRVTMHFSSAMLAMAAMLTASRANIEKVCDGEGHTTLTFTFGPEQDFVLVFLGQRLGGATMGLVEGPEPSTSAMLLVQADTNVDTVRLFYGLLSDGVLDVQVVADDGSSLSHPDVYVSYHEVAQVSETLAKIFKQLLDRQVGSQNIADHVESLRAQLVAQFGVRLAA